MRRIADAGRYVAGDQMAVSPQCGFASVESGNPMSAHTQEAKLRLVVELAETIWGSA
jgi:5-methyltetrahydropteroyltriglutamate--homocysteine methyltransferase